MEKISTKELTQTIQDQTGRKIIPTISEQIYMGASEEPIINDKFELFNKLVTVESNIQNVNTDWTQSSLNKYEKRFTVEMSRTGVFVEEWMKNGIPQNDKEIVYAETLAKKTGVLFSEDYMKRLILSRANNGMLVKGGILAVIGSSSPIDEGGERSGQQEKKGGFLSKMPLIGGVFGGK